MASRDLVESVLSSPMAWETFEGVVSEVLAQDDFPRLRKLGGGHDRGIDATDEAFYGSQVRLEAVVQVTMQRAQERKFRETIEKLRQSGLAFTQLVLVTKHPVSSGVRTSSQAAALESGVAVDIRDQSYLVAQLAKATSTVFARHFGGAREQLEKLFREKDPLSVTGTPAERAMLAVVGAYVLHPHSHQVRTELFDCTVLAALAATDVPVSPKTLAERVAQLVPEEAVDEARIRAAVDRLRDRGDCKQQDGQILATEAALGKLASVLASAHAAYVGLRDYVLNHSARAGNLDDAAKGYLERNLSRAVLALLQRLGPLEMTTGSLLVSPETSSALMPVLSEGLNEDIAKHALVALAGYVEDPQNTAELAHFVRSYGALAIRNLDPVGRRWQRSVLTRTAIALDTDAVLTLLIEELPEHSAIRMAILALQQDGIRLLVSEDVLTEVVLHVRNAGKTFRRFRDRIEYMPSALVDNGVWHAVVRGFYYACKNEQRLEWLQYFRKYYDRNDPDGYVRHLLDRRVKLAVERLDAVPERWEADFESIAADMLARKERHRLKAEFRDSPQMEQRIRKDVRMAMNLAASEGLDTHARPRGYVASEDHAFRAMEQHVSWKPRPKVHLWTRTLAQLAELVCGTVLPDDQIVALLFEPVTAAAAYLLEPQITALATYGVNLSSVPLDRLSWDLERGLLDAVRRAGEARNLPLPERLEAATNLVRSARNCGYSVQGPLREITDAYTQLVTERDAARSGQEKLMEALQSAVSAGAGLSRKGRARARRVLRELGISLPAVGPERTADSHPEDPGRQGSASTPCPLSG